MGMQCTFGVARGARGVDDQRRVLRRRVEGLEPVAVALELLMVIQHVGTLRGCIDDIAQL